MTTKLQIFKDAARELGLRTLSATDSDDLLTRTLAQQYDGAVAHCLEQGYWNFAMNAAELATEGGVAAFGYTYPYAKPAGWIRTVRLSASNTYWPPLEDYEDAKRRIQANVSPLYMVYTATDGGMDIANWPAAFSLYVACELARRACKQAGGSQETYDAAEVRAERTRVDALSKDAMDEGVRWPPEGRWSRARRGGSMSDRGNRGSLIG